MIGFQAQCDCYYDSPGTRGTLEAWTAYALRMKSGSIERDRTIATLTARITELEAMLHEVWIESLAEDENAWLADLARRAGGTT